MPQQPEPDEITDDRDEQRLERQRQDRRPGENQPSLSGDRGEGKQHQGCNAHLVEHGLGRIGAANASSAQNDIGQSPCDASHQGEEITDNQLANRAAAGAGKGDDDSAKRGRDAHPLNAIEALLPAPAEADRARCRQPRRHAERRSKRSRIHFRRRALTTFGTWAIRPSTRDNCGRPVMEIAMCMCATPSRLSVSVCMP